MQNKEKNFRSMEQIRAGKTWAMVRQAVQQKAIKEYAPLAKKLPGLIHQNGLGQTMAFMFSKYKDKHFKLLGEQIASWVMDKLQNKDMMQYSLPEIKNSNYIQKFICQIRDNDARYYRLATREALSLLNVLRNFASGVKQETQKPEKNVEKS